MQDFQFVKKLSEGFYKTAYSDIWETYVYINDVREDSSGRLILECTLADDPARGIVLFRPEELDFAL